MKGFKDYCREPTGAHFLDSGCAYGRHWERPPVAAAAPEVTWRARESATLYTWAYLDSRFKIDERIQTLFERWAARESNSRLSWFEAGEKFATGRLHLQQKARGNVCNVENDLSQVFVWEVYALKSERGDHCYAHDSTITVLYIHTGCDIRGGYTRPIFCRPRGSYSMPVDTCAEYRIDQARVYARVKYQQPAPLFQATGITEPVFEPGPYILDSGDCADLDEHWQSGYSSYPYGQLEKDVERWFEFTRRVDSVCVKRVSGEIAKVCAQMPYGGE